VTIAAPLLDVFGVKADSTGCGVLRIELPMTELRAQGMATGYAEGISDYLRTRALVGQRVCNPKISDRWQQLSKMSNRPRLILELDDDLWAIDATSPIAHAFFNQPGVQARLEANIRVSDAVTVTTEELADVVRPFNANVHVIPNRLPAWLLEHELPRREGVVTIGWGGSSTHQMDVSELGGQLRQVMARNPQTELHLMGSNYAQAMGVTKRVRHTEWTNSVPDYWRSIDYDVMLAPLRPHPFNASKSPLRPLEAAILGIPVIASDYGPYARFVKHGETGYLVKRDHEWGRYLRELVNDEAMREEMGAAGRRQAADWTVEGNVADWAKVIAG
jgi:glycosyltransferase involved in cell wall biosynthesis